MRLTGTSAGPWILAALTLAAGAWLWTLHARAWDLGGRSPVLGYDAAQYALAGRELAERGRLATTFALPIELVRHPQPPWPLAVVQPGLVLAEAAIERIAPRRIPLGPGGGVSLATPGEREWLSLALPAGSYLALALLLALGAAALLARHAPTTHPGARWAAGAVIGLTFLLDPEAQHFAAGGFTEIPFTLGAVAALAMVVSGGAARRPLLFGLLLGVTGSFRANILWLAPWFAVGAAALAGPGTRLRTLGLVLFGWALPLAPWWLYKWRSFGSPGADLSRLMLWEGVEGRTWFSLLHLPEEPALPGGARALALLGDKLWENLGRLTMLLATGPRALWIGAIAVWLATRPPRPLAVAGALVLIQALLGLLAASASIPWIRYVFPARVPLEAAGLLATWALIAHAAERPLGSPVRRALQAGVAALALGWAVWQCGLGLAEARAASAERGIPGTATLAELAARLDREAGSGEPIMSNLGPTLAYHARRPVVHLALAPEDIEACRARLTFDHVLLVFRGPERAWADWRPAMEPGVERMHPEWNVARSRRWRSADGFTVVWLELGAPRPQLARLDQRTTAMRRTQTLSPTVTRAR